MIEVKNVTKIYNYKTSKEIKALEDVNLRIEDNELVLLMGPSGSGKSTLLSLMAALTKPTFGSVIVDGENISRLPDPFAALFRRAHIGFIFQKFNLLEDLTVFDNVVLPLIPDKIEAKELEKRAQKVMEHFSISHKATQKVAKLSGGEQQRVAIARAMINDPDIVLADEPTANLDAKLTKSFLETLRTLKEEGKTIVIATHDPRFEKLEIVDRIFEVKEGHVLNA